MIITINTKEDSHEEIKRAIEVLKSIVESGYTNYGNSGYGSYGSSPNYGSSYGNTGSQPVANDGLFNLFNDNPSSQQAQQQPYPQTQSYPQQSSIQQSTTYPSDIGQRQQTSPFGLFQDEKKDEDDEPRVVPY